MIQAVMIDSREPEWVQKLTFGQAPVSVEFMPCGDAMVATEDGNILLIERKTPEDFLSTLAAGRLFHQLTDMLDQTRWSYLVITDTLTADSHGKVLTENRITNWDYSSVQGALVTAQEMGVFVCSCLGDADYVKCIERLAARERKADYVLAPVKIGRGLTAQEEVLASFPGIGLERMEKILEHCGTAGWALVGLTDKDSKIPGIGPYVKTRIRSALKLQDNEELAIVTIDE